MLQYADLLRNSHLQRVFLSTLGLIIPVITLMAIAGLGFLSSYSPLLIGISFTPSIVSLL